MSVHLFGIRHHGPGSARNVREYLEALRPDIVLVEGPPEADALLQWAADEAMKPPVALLCYRPDRPQQSIFYPFAEFSPEWQAITYARRHAIPVRFFDLPVAHMFGIEEEAQRRDEQTKTDPSTPEAEPDAIEAGGPAPQGTDVKVAEEARRDPIGWLAEAAGYADGEEWWEQMFEYRQEAGEVFEAIGEAMGALRSTLPQRADHREALREAHMRRAIRQAEKELYTTVAVICGAWHVPGLKEPVKAKDDNELLKGLPKVKVECTWIPWTYDRLSLRSGYGAGIGSPGWYGHLWQHPNDDGTRWMSRVAALFRGKGMDTSVAHVIEAVRLATALSSLRGLPRVGLAELEEATRSVLCGGEDLLMQLLHDELIVGHVIGEVPEVVPRPPLQVDIEKTQKTLRLPATADFKDYTLDLRKDTDLARSVFLHRLRLLGIGWGEQTATSGKGTFKEQWRLQWTPSFAVDVIEKGNWGNTVAEAANNFIRHEARKGGSVPSIARLLVNALPADLNEAVNELLPALNNAAAASTDVVQLMESLEPLVRVARYGNVRRTDAELVLRIVDTMVTRICIGLPNAVSGIADEAAQELLDQMRLVHEALALLQQASMDEAWIGALRSVLANSRSAPVLRGYAARLLYDRKELQGEELERRFRTEVSLAAGPDRSAAWLEGFLRGSGTLLLLDTDLWSLVDEWVATLDPSVFIQVLPLLRRTFSLFTRPERRQLGEKARSGNSGHRVANAPSTGLDPARAATGIPIVLRLLGIPLTDQTNPI
ncbi:DUF5682 family protein [Flaviaesturariibacter amylovorans]|uniref:DUF5682 family protein n=1 Tax=Flaviaesturariibacter amylovorans TaxID=1084520 RepID=A0ABP8GZI5_9BACT